MKNLINKVRHHGKKITIHLKRHHRKYLFGALCSGLLALIAMHTASTINNIFANEEEGFHCEINYSETEVTENSVTAYLTGCKEGTIASETQHTFNENGTYVFEVYDSENNFTDYEAYVYRIGTGIALNNKNLTQVCDIYDYQKYFVINCSDKRIIDVDRSIFYDYQNLKLNLSSNQINYINYETFSGVNNIKELNLSGNNISLVNNVIFSGLNNLESLNLSNNDIQDINANIFSSLYSLKYLYLSNNIISAINNDIFSGLNSLNTLDLSSNNISSIDSNTFSSLNNLSSLNLSNNNISNIDSGAFLGLNNLESLDLDYNNISNIDSGTFLGLDNLDYLDLIYNNISTIDSEAFSSLSNLEFLFLYNNNISTIDSEAFSSLSNLVWLFLNSNNISSIESLELSNLVNLESLNLSNNKISNIKSGSFYGLSNLKELYLNNNIISDIESGAFNSLNNLISLDLGYNNISTIDSEAFSSLSNLDGLSLHNNNISDINPGTFDSLNNLKSLGLSNNNISNIIPGSFKFLNNLEGLGLSNNKIIELEIGVFSGLNNVREIDLSYNQMAYINPGIFYGLDNLGYTLYAGLNLWDNCFSQNIGNITGDNWNTMSSQQKLCFVSKYENYGNYVVAKLDLTGDVNLYNQYSGYFDLNKTILFTSTGTEYFDISERSGDSIFIKDFSGIIHYPTNGKVIATVNFIDNISPTCNVAYSTTGATTGNVVASLTGCSETITGTDLQHTFTGNGTYTFEFQDLASNTGSTEATVTWINNTYSIIYDSGANITYKDAEGHEFTGIGTIAITDGTTSITMLDRNLGATTNDISKTGSYGYRFQWGNNHGFTDGCWTHRCSDTVTQQATTTKARWNDTYNHSGYYGTRHISLDSEPYDYWQTGLHNGLRGGENDSERNNRGFDILTGTASNRQGPCPDGFHVPSAGEWGMLVKYYAQANSITYSGSNGIYSLNGDYSGFMDTFKLPLAGTRFYYSVIIGDQESKGAYRSSSLNNSGVYRLLMYKNHYQYQDNVLVTGDSYRVSSFNMRCFKNPSSTGITFSISFDDNIKPGEFTTFTVRVLKDGLLYDNYTGSILFTLTNNKGGLVNKKSYTIYNSGHYTFEAADGGRKIFYSGLKIDEAGTYTLEIRGLDNGGIGSGLVYVGGKHNAADFEYDTLKFNPNYSDEMNEAYQYARYFDITTKDNIKEADMYSGLNRIAMAKMLTNYAENVLGVNNYNTGRNCRFVDVTTSLDKDYDYGVTKACQLGIMGVNMPNNKFYPNGGVTRAEFATALSRLLYGTPDGVGQYYSTHLVKLYQEKIIKNTDPTLRELRGYVMLMLMRSDKK